MPAHWRVRELKDRDTIRAYLNTDRLYSAYALGDLEPSLFPHCRWWLTERVPRVEDQQWALLLQFAGLTPNAVVCLGEPEGVGILLTEAPLPETLYLVCRRSHMEPAATCLDLPAPRHMARMVLRPEQFRPAAADRAVRLATDRLEELQTLYALDPGAADAFAPYQLVDGIFFGVEHEGNLVSVAGTHLLATKEGIGAIGNIFTHPVYRRLGHAAACTSAVGTELLARGLTTVLNVGTENHAALGLYQRLGFETVCSYYETIATRINKEVLDDEQLRREGPWSG